MFGLRTRALTGMTLLATTCGLASNAQAQLFPWINSCGTCSAAAAPMPVATQIVHTAAVTDCPCMKPVQEMVYQDVQRVEYQPIQKVVKAAKVVTVMEDQPVTTYQTVTEARVVDVPTTVSQQVTEMQPVTVNRSYWQTQWQQIPKQAPCTYDNRPGLLPEMNRMGYAMRNTFTPNYVARREFVPNVQTSQVAVTRTMQVPATRQVTYNVSKVVPITTTQKVPVQRMVYEDQTVTAMMPITTTQRVAVGTRTRMVYAGDLGTSSSASASAEPTPTAAAPSTNQSASKDKGTMRLNSAPAAEPAPIIFPTQQRDAAPQQPQAAPAEGPVAGSESADQVIQFAGWRKSRHAEDAPALSVVQK
jgi:hypothetical protein